MHFTCRIVHNYCVEHRPRSQTVSSLLNDRTTEGRRGKSWTFSDHNKKKLNLFLSSHENGMTILTNIVVSSNIFHRTLFFGGGGRGV